MNFFSRPPISSLPRATRFLTAAVEATILRQPDHLANVLGRCQMGGRRVEKLGMLSDRPPPLGKVVTMLGIMGICEKLRRSTSTSRDASTGGRHVGILGLVIVAVVCNSTWADSTKSQFGAIVRDMDRRRAKAAGMEETRGVYIHVVLPNSPAKRSGFQEGDILLTLEGQPIYHRMQFVPAVGRISPGSTVSIEFLRDGEKTRSEVQLEATPSKEDLFQAILPEAQAGKAWAQSLAGQFILVGIGVQATPEVAVQWLKLAAEQDDVEAIYHLAMAYHQGNGVEKDCAKSQELFRKLAEAGFSAGDHSIGMMYATGDGVEKDYGKAYELLHRAAENDFWEAQVKLGVLHLNGWGVDKNDAEAARWYRKAAEAEVADAQYRLGELCEAGRGVTQDFSQALEWYRRAAGQDYVNAFYRLGMMYANGRGATRDDGEAVRWIQKAAEHGHLVAQNDLGTMYESGRGVAQNLDDALHWYRKAAEAGNPMAQTNLGAMCQAGRGVKKDEKLAVEWFHKAAQQGFVVGQHNMGVMVAEGQGVARDYRVAMQWLRLAADQGYAQAQTYIGYLYENGHGVSRDREEAIRWYRQAALQGDETARANLETLGVQP